MILRFTLIALLVTSVMVSCEKEETVTANTGFYSFKETSYYRTPPVMLTNWTFDSVEVYEPIPNTLALRHIENAVLWDSVKLYNNGALTIMGAFFPHFTIDPITNNITNVVNIFPDDGRGRKAFLEAGYTSRYDPAAKTFYLYYYMTQNGRPDMIFHDTLTALP